MTLKEWLLILGGVGGGIGLVLAAMATGFLTTGREKRAFRRQQQKERYERLRTLYEEAISALIRCLREAGTTEAVFQEKLENLRAQLALSATEEIYQQYCKTGGLIDDWLDYKRQTQPRRAGGMLIYSSGDFQGMQAAEEKADEILPSVESNIAKMRTLMTAHLASQEPSL